MTRFRVIQLLTAVLLAYVLLQQLRAHAAEPDSRVGEKIGPITFKDIRYLRRTLNDFRNKRAFVVIATNTTCPVAQQYFPKLIQMEQKYRDQGVQFVALYTSDAESVIEMAEHALKFDLPFPVVQDIEHQCIQAIGLSRTPEVAVLDAEYLLRYRGRIDDQFRTGGAQAAATQENLKDAIDAVLAGTDVPLEETPVDGCAITPTPNAEPRSDITYAEHIRPLLQKHCAECHRPGTEAPFSLLTYEDVTAHGAMIAEVVEEQRMPPWYAGPFHRDFINARGMSRDERVLVTGWVAAGMPAGDLQQDVNQPPTDDAGFQWTIPEPDKVIAMSEPHTLPATGFIPYQYCELPYDFQNDTWLQSIEIVADNPRVVHHCFLLANSTFISAKVPGVQPLDLEGTGIGLCIPKGTRFTLQMHYTTTGKPETCRIAVGLKYCREPVQKRIQVLRLKKDDFKVPAGDPHYEVAESIALDKDSLGFGLLAHMHLRGKDMSFWARYPDGKSEQLLTVPNYNFDWQIGYQWEPSRKRFPKGTQIEVIAHYDNSAFNPYNPDPTIDVQEGEQTFQEMFDPYFYYTSADEHLNVHVDPRTGRAIPTWGQLFGSMWRSFDPLSRAILIFDIFAGVIAVGYVGRYWKRRANAA